MLTTLILALLIPTADAGCTTDMQCKGERICVESACVYPQQPAAWVEPAPATSEPAPVSQARENWVEAMPWDPQPAQDDSWITGFRLPRGSRVLVAPFRDHSSLDPRDSVDTGIISQREILEGLEELDTIRARSAAPRSYDPAVGLDEAEAAALGRSLGADYVVFGECIDFYRVAPMTWRADHAGVRVRVVSADGELVFQRTWKERSVTNFSTPEEVIENIGEEFRDLVAPR